MRAYAWLEEKPSFFEKLGFFFCGCMASALYEIVFMIGISFESYGIITKKNLDSPTVKRISMQTGLGFVVNGCIGV